MEALRAAGARTHPEAAALLGIGDKHLRTLLNSLRLTKSSNIEKQLQKLGVSSTLGFEVSEQSTLAMERQTVGDGRCKPWPDPPAA